ncbi:MAG: hypothetical protein ACUVQY_06150 [Thermoproteota archaeon]
MRKMWVVLGIILMLCGFIVTSYGNAPKEIPNLIGQPKQSSINATSIGDYYNRTQKLLLGIAPGKDWYLFTDTSDEFVEGGKLIPVVSVTVMVIDPQGKTTHLEAEYRVVEGTESIALLVVKVYNKSDGLILKTFYHNWTDSFGNTYTGEYLYEREIGGIVNFDGLYTITVSLLGPPIPPSRLTLYKYRIDVVNERWFLFPVGGALIAFGGVMSIWAARSTPRKTRPTLKK